LIIAGSVKRQWGAQILLITSSSNSQKILRINQPRVLGLLKIIKELVPGGWFVGKELEEGWGCWVSVGSLTSSMIVWEPWLRIRTTNWSRIHIPRCKERTVSEQLNWSRIHVPISYPPVLASQETQPHELPSLGLCYLTPPPLVCWPCLPRQRYCV
jgi:hypothetical protein